MKNVLVLCTGNSCRSQIAHGYLSHFAGEKANIFSAGIETHGVNPKAIAVMMEDNIDISHHTSNNVDEYINKILLKCEKQVSLHQKFLIILAILLSPALQLTSLTIYVIIKLLKMGQFLRH